ncbi:DNA mismatch repair protein MutS [Photobacterium aphoticum]|uniref:DNA mismatch repair protein MutS n=1 Tax=Photobacterium aphoticum TaxID=754436 RepID=A0A090RL85_9GAMM|nr:DNA mismatch repair protein MutS [Photobacterium aphoticum]
MNGRLDAISAFKDTSLFLDLAGVLRHMGDLERILARLALRSARPRDLARMRTALQHLPEVSELLSEISQPRIGQLAQAAAPMDELCELLERAIIENPPVVIRDGGVLAPATTPNSTNGVTWPTAQPNSWKSWKRASVNVTTSTA